MTSRSPLGLSTENLVLRDLSIVRSRASIGRHANTDPDRGRAFVGTATISGTANGMTERRRSRPRVKLATAFESVRLFPKGNSANPRRVTPPYVQ